MDHPGRVDSALMVATKSHGDKLLWVALYIEMADADILSNEKPSDLS
jgi:hypothetical protein